jgi:hypothetical protein
MQDVATAHVKDKLALGILELSQGPYRSRYFLVVKKNDEHRFINDVQWLNKVAIRDYGMPPSVDKFSEDFAGYPITSAIDYFSGYYQIPLDKSSRDLTAFMTLLGLVRMTRLPQDWTNSVAEFIRIIGKVHIVKSLMKYVLFLMMLASKGLRIDIMMRKFLLGFGDLCLNMLRSSEGLGMRDCWITELTISGTKSAIGMSDIEIVGFLCDQDGRRPEPRNVQRTLDWSIPGSTRDARAFIGIVVYYRIFILDFEIIATPIFALFRKSRRFIWTGDCQTAMDTFKMKITEAPVLVNLNFSASALLLSSMSMLLLLSDGEQFSRSNRRMDDGTLRVMRLEFGRMLNAGMMCSSWNVGDCSSHSRNFVSGYLGGTSLFYLTHKHWFGSLINL